MPRAILALNGGSSSIKFALARIADATPSQMVAAGVIEGIGTSPHLVAKDGESRVLYEQSWPHDQAPAYDDLLDRLLTWIDDHLGDNRLAAAGHRVVHGGSVFTAAVRVTEPILATLAGFAPLAPLHQLHNLAPIRTIRGLRPDLPQVACFDTAFHHTQPAVATRFALPRAYEQEGVRRYGFHGLSYEYIAGRLLDVAPAIAHGRVIVAHLGNGASLCAMQDRQSIDTTMGFTALDGLMMGTRCGAIDPGVLLYMQQARQMTAQQIEHVLYQESGLLGVSGISSDMRDLLTSQNPQARDAIDLFVYRIAQEVAALATSLNGLDGLVFTAGIGEHAAEIRSVVCERLRWLGIELDTDANQRHAARISTDNSRIAVHIIPTDEEAMIHRHTLEHLKA